jgi:hypothetical protein
MARSDQSHQPLFPVLLRLLPLAVVPQLTGPAAAVQLLAHRCDACAGATLLPLSDKDLRRA